MFPGGFNAFQVARDARRTVRSGSSAVEQRQRTRLAELVHYARGHSPFYAQLYSGLPNEVELGALPVVSKPQLMAHFDDWVTDPEVTRTAVQGFISRPDTLGQDFLGRYLVFTTSGSTGEPMLVVQDQRALAVMNGLVYGRLPRMPAALLYRLMHGGFRVAAVFATGGHFLSTSMYERRLRTAPFRRRFARLFSVLDPLPRLVDQLNDFRPAAVGSYPSVLEVLAEEQSAGRLHISPVLLVAGGERLLPAVRRRVEEVFGCAVMDLYSASEASPLTMPCRFGVQHLNSDWFILEPIDSEGRPVPPGKLSASSLLTNLANHVQPVIRYELGDAVEVGAAPCRCGSPLPTLRVEGRTDDILRLSGTHGEVALLPMALGTVVEETPGVHRFQVLQTGPAALSVRIDTLEGWAREAVWDSVRLRLQGYLSAQGLTDAELGLAPEAPQLQPRSGKLRHIFRAEH